MNEDKKQKLRQKALEAKLRSDAFHQKWQSEITDEEHRWGRMVADISICLGDFMTEKGITQRALAEKMGVKESSVSRLLGTDHNPTLRTIAKLETAIGETLVLTPRSALRFIKTGSVEIPEGESNHRYLPYLSGIQYNEHLFMTAGANLNYSYGAIDIEFKNVETIILSNHRNANIGDWQPRYDT